MKRINQETDNYFACQSLASHGRSGISMRSGRGRIAISFWRGTFFSLLWMNFLFPADLLSSQVNVLTANYDNSRTNSNLNETILNPSNVNLDHFGKIGSFPVDGQVYAQALYAAGIQVPGKGVRNVVYTVTMHNTVYAFDADSPTLIVPLWQVNLGPSVPSSVLNFSDILPEVG